MGMDDTTGLLPRMGNGKSGWHSRDYAPFVECKVSCCPCNKNDLCELPANIKINANGTCQTGLDFMVDARAKTKTQLDKIDSHLQKHKPKR